MVPSYIEHLLQNIVDEIFFGTEMLAQPPASPLGLTQLLYIVTTEQLERNVVKHKRNLNCNNIEKKFLFYAKSLPNEIINEIYSKHDFQEFPFPCSTCQPTEIRAADRQLLVTPSDRRTEC